MLSLLDLCPEILEEVFLKLESVEDVISLCSFSPYLARTVCQESIWRIFLAKTEFVDGGRVMQDTVRKIASFLSSLKDSSAILSLINQKIYQRYPGQLACEAPTPSRGMVYGFFYSELPLLPPIFTQCPASA